MLYMISYDLMTPGQNYKNLGDRIKATGGVEVLRSQWLVTSPGTADAVWRDLSGSVDNNDRLLVTELTHDAQWRQGALLVPDATMRAFLASARC
jgi:hypothetical protein